MARKSQRLSAGAATTLPSHKRAASNTSLPAGEVKKSKTQKATPTKSQYFTKHAGDSARSKKKADDSGDELAPDDDDDEDELTSAPEDDLSEFGSAHETTPETTTTMTTTTSTRVRSKSPSHAESLLPKRSQLASRRAFLEASSGVKALRLDSVLASRLLSRSPRLGLLAKCRIAMEASIRTHCFSSRISRQTTTENG
jgi:hypothetical protein